MHPLFIETWYILLCIPTYVLKLYVIQFLERQIQWIVTHIYQVVIAKNVVVSSLCSERVEKELSI